MKIGIIGMGFVGGTTAKVFSRKHKIFPYDRFKEPYTSIKKVEDIAKEVEVAFLCVPTPMKKDRSIDYSAIDDSLNLLNSVIKYVNREPNDLLVTIRSTAVSGTTDSLASKYQFRFAFNPEFLTERNALKDMKNTKHVVLGVKDERSKKQLLAIYKPLFPDAHYTIVDRKTAEMIKYGNNASLAINVIFANELEKICSILRIDYDVVKEALLRDPRNSRFLNVPGHDGYHGFGGKCFPKDLNALIHLALTHGYHPHFLEEAWRTNLELREVEDWDYIPGAVEDNKDFKK